jgi:arabinogalactan endo-1,4-beta-galactosidase
MVFMVVRGVWAAEWIAGADLSHLQFFEDRSVVYRENGQTNDAFKILQRRGLKCVRLRLFTSSPAKAQADPYNRINNLDYTIPLAVRVKRAGLQFLLDFHYSDTWADPGKQTKPSAWTNLSFAQLEQTLFEYNRDCITAFRSANAMPEYVQVGNEIISGMLWPDGKVGGNFDNPTQWSQLGRLIQAAVRGINAAAGASPPKIMIHIDRGGDWTATKWFFDHLQQQKVEFDFIGESYYPFWHGSLDALRACLNQTAERYHKPVIVAETAFPWTNSTNLLGLPASPEGQVSFILELAKILKGVPEDLGAGVFWWGTEYQHLPGVNTAGFESRSFFGSGGEVLPAASTLGGLTSRVSLHASRDGARLTIQWPVSGVGLSLMTATNLRAPVFWRALGNPISTTVDHFTTTLAIDSDPTGFFLLQ